MTPSSEQVPDLLGPGLRLLFVGINPSLTSARTGFHFAHPGNRFYPALREAGIIDPEAVTLEECAEALLGAGVGITNLVPRPTARADELSDDEVRGGRARVLAFVEEHRPAVVAVAGVTSYRLAFGERRATAGRQPRPLGPATLWVVPNPSGLNAHETIATLAAAYAEPAREAGILPRSPRAN